MENKRLWGSLPTWLGMRAVNTTYSNQGSGTFVAGPETEQKL